MKVGKYTDPGKPGSKRVFKDAADKARQSAMEGADTSFQRSLRFAEATGQKTFPWRGGSYAARTGGSGRAKPMRQPKTQRVTDYMTQGAPDVPFNPKMRPKRELPGEKPTRERSEKPQKQKRYRKKKTFKPGVNWLKGSGYKTDAMRR